MNEEEWLFDLTNTTCEFAYLMSLSYFNFKPISNKLFGVVGEFCGCSKVCVGDC